MFSLASCGLACNCTDLNGVLPIADDGFGVLVEGLSSIQLHLSLLCCLTGTAQAALDPSPLLCRHHHCLEGRQQVILSGYLSSAAWSSTLAWEGLGCLDPGIGLNRSSHFPYTYCNTGGFYSPLYLEIATIPSFFHAVPLQSPSTILYYCVLVSLGCCLATQNGTHPRRVYGKLLKQSLRGNCVRINYCSSRSTERK